MHPLRKSRLVVFIVLASFTALTLAGQTDTKKKPASPPSKQQTNPKGDGNSGNSGGQNSGRKPNSPWRPSK